MGTLPPLCSPPLMKLHLSKLDEASYDEESNIFEPMVLFLNLPDGTTKEWNVSTGDTIQMIKKRIEVELGLMQADTRCELDGKNMIEPLSLNDFATLMEKKADHEVSGPPTIDVKLNTETAEE